MSIFYGAYRPLSYKGKRKFVEGLARRLEVSVDHLLDIIKKRRAYRTARMYRRRSRKRTLMENPNAAKRYQPIDRYSGEGDFLSLMRKVGLTQAEFCRITGEQSAKVTRWCGWPMYPLPVEFLRWYGFARNCARILAEQGVDVAKLWPEIPKMTHKQGHYPRKKGDIRLVDPVPPPYRGPWNL